MPIESLIGIAVYILAVVGLAWLSSRKESREQYMISARALGPFAIAASMIAGWTNMGLVMGLSTIAFLDPLYAFWFSLGIILSVTAVAFMAGPIRRIANDAGLYTMPEFILHFYGQGAAFLMAAMIFVIYFIIVIMEFMAGGILLSSYAGISPALSVLILGGVVALYLMLGGFNTMIRTDVLQCAFIFLFAIIMLTLGGNSDFSGAAAMQKITAAFGELSWTGGLIIMLYTAPAQFVAPDLWQRIYASRSTSAARNGLLITAAVMTIFYLIGTPFLISGLAAAAPDTDPQNAFPALLNLFMPDQMIPLLLVALMAVIMSSIDSFSFVTGQALVYDGFAKFIPALKNRPKLATRIGVGVVLLVAMGLSLVLSDITVLLYLIIYLFSCLLPFLYCILMKNPPSRTGTMTAVILATIANIALYIPGLLNEAINVGIAAAAMVFPFVFDVVQRRSGGGAKTDNAV